MMEFFHSDALLPTLCIILVSSSVQGMSGFGMGLIAIPLLTLLMEPKMVVPATTLASMAISAMIIVQLHQHCDWRRAAWLGIPALLAAPFGVHLLKVLTSEQLCTGLGAVLMVNAVLSLWQRWRTRHHPPLPQALHIRPVGSIVVGGISGVIGGAVGMTGPLLADHLNKSGIQPEAFRITLNLIFIASSTWRTGLYFANGILAGPTLGLAAAALPAAIVGAAIGGRLGRRVRPDAFTTSINWFLLLVGLCLILENRH